MQLLPIGPSLFRSIVVLVQTRDYGIIGDICIAYFVESERNVRHLRKIEMGGNYGQYLIFRFV